MTNTSFSAGAKAGAITAACLLFTAIAIPAFISVLISPSSAGWIAIVFLFSIPWIGAAAFLGAFAGGLATRATDAIIGGIVGAGLSVLLPLLYSVMFVSQAEEKEVHTSIRLLL